MPKLMEAYKSLTPEERRLVNAKYVELGNRKDLDFADEEFIKKDKDEALWIRSFKDVGLYNKIVKRIKSKI